MCCVTVGTCPDTISSNTDYYEGGCTSPQSSAGGFGAGCTKQGECVAPFLEVGMGGLPTAGIMAQLPQAILNRLNRHCPGVDLTPFNYAAGRPSPPPAPPSTPIPSPPPNLPPPTPGNPLVAATHDVTATVSVDLSIHQSFFTPTVIEAMIAKVADVMNVHPENVGIAVIRPQDRSDAASTGGASSPPSTPTATFWAFLRITIGYASVADASAGRTELASQFVDAAAVSLLLDERRRSPSRPSMRRPPSRPSMRRAPHSRGPRTRRPASRPALSSPLSSPRSSASYWSFLWSSTSARKELRRREAKFNDITMEMKDEHARTLVVGLYLAAAQERIRRCEVSSLHKRERNRGGTVWGTVRHLLDADGGCCKGIVLNF